MTATKLLQVIMPLFLIIVPAGLSYFLAKDKGRNIGLWTALGLISFLNLVFLLFFLSATNLRLEAKLDRIITSLDAQQ